MSQPDGQPIKDIRFYDFGPFRVDTHSRLLLRDREIVPLTSKVFDVLLVFIEHRGRMLDKEELMELVWPGCFVEEGNLTRNVSMLRKALGENPREHQYIVTVPGHGYRFVPTVVEVQTGNGDLLIQEFTETHITVEETEYPDAQVPSADSDPTLPIPGRQRRSFSKTTRVLVVCGGLVVAGILFIGFILTSPRFARTASRPLLRISRLNLSNCYDATISPDGKFLAFVLWDGGRQSLWLRQVATARDSQLLEPADVRFFGVTFSPDGNYIYYVVSDSKASEQHAQRAALYKLALLGGPTTKVKEDLDSPVSFSPDGIHYTFTREYTTEGESALIVASLTGPEETTLATQRMPEYFDFPAWSPDGKLIACVVASFKGPHQIMFYPADKLSTAVQLRVAKPWGLIMKLLWSQDGSTMFVDAKDPALGGGLQIWRMAYPSGEVQRITNDTDSYVRLSATAKSDILVGVESATIDSLWIQPGNDSAQAKELISSLDGFSGMSWTADGRIVYAASSGTNPEIWAINEDGTGQKQLTADNSASQHPIVSPDGRYIYFTNYRPDSEDIWRIETNGSNETLLTSGKHAFSLTLTRDGKWIIFTSRGLDRWSTLWKVPSEGGEPSELNNNLVRSPVVSPDGKLIACFYVDANENTQTKQPSIALIPVDGGSPEKIFETSTTVNFLAGLQWTIDGKAVTYVDNRSGYSNIWGQPIDGKAPEQLTNFKGGQISAFAWSQQGDRLAFLRGIEKTYAVVLTNVN